MLKEKVVEILNAKREAKKVAFVGEIDAFYDGLIAEVNALDDEGGPVVVPSDEVAALKAELEGKNVEIQNLKDLLAKVDAKAKELDALVPDAQ